MKYAVEIHEKFKDNTYGDLVKVLGIFNTEKEALECLFIYEDTITDKEVIDIYECE